MRSFKVALMAGILPLLSCASPRGLSVKMYNAKTQSVLNCAAQPSPMVKDNTLLYDAVDNCVRQLEARGYERVDDSFKPSPLNTGSIPTFSSRP